MPWFRDIVDALNACLITVDTEIEVQLLSFDSILRLGRATCVVFVWDVTRRERPDNVVAVRVQVSTFAEFRMMNAAIIVTVHAN